MTNNKKAMRDALKKWKSQHWDAPDIGSDEVFAEGYQASAANNEQQVKELVEAGELFRDCVLNQRFQLEEPCLDGDQTNAVLSLFDDTIGAALAKHQGGSLCSTQN